MLIAFLFIVALAGLVVAGIGLRGRVVSTKSHCRRCRYELTGLDITASCPECGLQVSKRRNRVFELRHIRGRFIGIGILLFVMGAVPLVLAVSVRALNVDIEPYKPEWLLFLELRDPVQEVRALAEIDRRYVTGSLSKRAITTYATTGIKKLEALPRDKTISWREYDLIQQFMLDGALDASLCSRLLAQIVEIRLLAPPRIHADENLEYRVKFAWRVPDPGMMTTGSNQLTVALEQVQIAIDDIASWNLDEPVVAAGVLGIDDTVVRYLSSPDIEIAPGTHGFSLRGKLIILDNRRFPGSGIRKRTVPLYVEPFQIETDVRIVSRDDKQRKGLRGAERDRWFAANVTTSSLVISASGTLAHEFRVCAYLYIAEDRPCAASFDAVFVANSVPISAGRFDVPAGGEKYARVLEAYIPDKAPPAVVELYLFPSDGLWRLDQPEEPYWGGTLHFKNLTATARRYGEPHLPGTQYSRGVVGEVVKP